MHPQDLDHHVPVSKAVLVRFEPIARLSPNRLDELAPLCLLEHINKDLDPTRMLDGQQAMYLVKGELGVRYLDGSKAVIRAGSESAKQAIDKRVKIKDTIALSNIDIVRIDLDLLDIMLTWDQLSGYPPAQSKAASKKQASNGAANISQLDASNFNAFQLHSGAFAKLPAANIQAMFARMTAIDVEADDVIINQGQEGDYYYLIAQGVAIVSRVNELSKPAVTLAEISIGAGFGEEALASDNKRNATVTMKTDGQLLRLKKQDFIELLKEPIISQINMQAALTKIANGAVWLDVRFDSEYKHQHLEGAVNTPLHKLRMLAPKLDKTREYIVYCQTGRRSSAAAFILAQFEVQVQVLEGGMKGN